MSGVHGSGRTSAGTLMLRTTSLLRRTAARGRPLRWATSAPIAHTSKYTLDPREHPHSPVHAHHSYSRHAQYVNGHISRDRQHPQSQNTYSGPPRVDARELVRGQKERTRRAVAAYDSDADERYNSAYDSAAGMKRKRSDAPAPEYQRAEVDNDDIDAMLLETATDGERDSQRVPRALPSPLSSASPPAPAPAALKPVPTTLLGSAPPSRTPSAPVPLAEHESEHEAKVFPPTNAAGERICRACGAAGRIKDGRCVEKWGPGPLGPGTVCDRCRKNMKRVERRVTGAGSLVVRNGSGSVRGGGVVYRKPAPASPRVEQGLQHEDTLLVDAPSRDASASPDHNGYSTLPPRAPSGGTHPPTPPYISSLSMTRDHSPAARSHDSTTYPNSRSQMQLSPHTTHAHAPVSYARSAASDAEAEAEDEGDAELHELMDAADAASVVAARSCLSVGSEASAFD